MNLPNREELLFRVVFAFPKASSTGLAKTKSWSWKELHYWKNSLGI